MRELPVLGQVAGAFRAGEVGWAEIDPEVSTWTIARLSEYVGGLSTPSKMPGFAYSLPAAECQTGGRLQAVEGSTCHGCYALKGRYAFPGTKAAMYRRLERLQRPLWADVMGELINRRASVHPYFRWHDSGDLQGVWHLELIARVAALTPRVAHWLPTREYRIVREYIGLHGAFPPNLTVRLSAHMIGGRAPTFPDLAGHVTVSTVSRENEAGGYSCPARFQGNACGDCRACWARDVAHVDYHLH